MKAQKLLVNSALFSLVKSKISFIHDSKMVSSEATQFYNTQKKANEVFLASMPKKFDLRDIYIRSVTIPGYVVQSIPRKLIFS